MEEVIKQRLADLDAGGGLIAAIERGDLQREHARAFYEEQRRVETGEKVAIGVNKFAISDEEEREIEVFEYDPGIQERQIERLRKVREGRDASAVGRALSELHRGAQAKENMIPYFIEAVKVYATIGEIIAVLKQVHGEWLEPRTV
jgi:methylmalonyl-CoA mutase N-terminal domain/subunit